MHDKLIEFVIDNDADYDFQKIDFGTGEIIVGIKKGGSATINDLIEAIRQKAMVTPVYIITNAINRIS